jgi:outer membrane receptor protein involved in Fe transport
MIQDQIKVDDRVVVLAGLRRGDAIVEVEGAPQSAAEANAWTHRVGMVYLAGGGFAPYASYRTSFQPYGGTDRLGRAFQPIRGRQWETGVKWMPEVGRDAGTVAAYVLKERNRPSPDPVRQGRGRLIRKHADEEAGFRSVGSPYRREAEPPTPNTGLTQRRATALRGTGFLAIL